MQDPAFLWTRRRGLLQVVLGAAGAALLGIGLIFYFVARATRHRMRESIRDIFRRAADGEGMKDLPRELQPIVRDLDEAVRRIRDRRESEGALTGPQKLRELVSKRMPDTKLVLVANREPYIHMHREGEIRLMRPASGLVTGVEPLLRAARRSRVRPAANLADSGGRGRLLLRLRERGTLAALPHRAHLADVPLERLGAIPERQQEICGCRPRGGGRSRHFPCAGLSLRGGAGESSIQPRELHAARLRSRRTD